MDLLSGLERLGVPLAAVVVLAVLFLKSVPPLVDSFIKARTETQAQALQTQAQLVSVIQSNTAAMQALRDITATNCSQLVAHDQRVDGLGVVIERIEQTVNRIEHAVVSVAHLPGS